MSYVRRVPISLALMSALLLVGTSAAQATITPVKVLGGRLNQTFPRANANFLGWSQETPTGSGHFDAWVMSLATGERTRLNRGRSGGGMGGIEPGTNTAIYQQYNRRDSNLVMVDLGTMTRSAPPEGINTSHWEYWPTISTEWILFARNDGARRQLILWNRSTNTPTVIASIPYRRGSALWTGGLSARYATWARCDRVHCRSFYYDTQSKTVTEIPGADARHDVYAPAPSDLTGNLYFSRSETGGCGIGVSIMRWQVGSATAPVALVDLPDGIDTDLTAAVFTDAASNDNYYFGWYHCATKQEDVYELPGAQG